MSKNIRLSPKHGLNPSLIVCFWCGEATGVALFGRLKGDAEAPRHITGNHEPCEACAARFAQGVTFFEVSADPVPDQPPPLTGRYLVVKESAVGELLQPELAKQVLDAGKAMVPVDFFEMLMPDEPAPPAATPADAATLLNAELATS